MRKEEERRERKEKGRGRGRRGEGVQIGQEGKRNGMMVRKGKGGQREGREGGGRIWERIVERMKDRPRRGREMTEN